MAHKKAAGSAKNLRDSNAKYRWVKTFGGQTVVAWNIILRQKWQKFVSGPNTYEWKDSTIHAGTAWIVAFKKKNITRFDGRKYLKTIVNVIPHGEEKKTVVKKAAKDLTPKTPTKKAPTKKTAAKKTSTKKTTTSKKATK